MNINTEALNLIAAFLGIDTGTIEWMGCLNRRNGLGEPVCDASVVIAQAWRHFWVNEYTGNVREYTWDRER